MRRRTFRMNIAQILAGAANDDPASLELTPDHMRRLGEEALARVSAHVATIAEENRATAGLLERVVRRERVMLTGCLVDGRFLARVCVLSLRTHQAQISACAEDVAAELPSVRPAS